MNSHLNPHKTGLVLGKTFALVHIVWVLLVALGWAQSLLTFSQWAHMVSVPVVVEAFDLTAAVTVILFAAAIGYVVGYAFAKIWNWVNRG